MHATASEAELRGVRERHGDGVDPGERHRERGAELVGLVEGVDVEEGLARHPHGDVGRQAGGVEDAAGPQIAGRVLRALGHDGGVAGDLGVGEEGRHQLALPAPEIALAGEEPLARQRLERPAQAGRLAEALGLLHEHLVEDLGPVGEDHRGARRQDAAEVALLADHAVEEASTVVPDLAHVAEAGGAGEEGDVAEVHGWRSARYAWWRADRQPTPSPSALLVEPGDANVIDPLYARGSA